MLAAATAFAGGADADADMLRNKALAAYVSQVKSARGDDDKVRSLVALRTWWRATPQPYKTKLDKASVKAVATLIDDKASTFTAAIILYGVGANLRYSSPALSRKIAMESKRVKALNAAAFPMKPTSGWQDLEALKCLQYKIRVGADNEKYCKLLAYFSADDS
jgi:hypothetical protein